MALLLSTNIAGSINVTSNASFSGVLSANSITPANSLTCIQTGMAQRIIANAQTAVTTVGGNTAQTTNAFCMTFNETGMYSVEGLIVLGGNISSANASNVGINVAFFNSGTANINYVAISYIGFCNGAGVGSTQQLGKAQTTITLSNGSTANVSLSNAVGTNAAVDFVVINGMINVSATGTGNVAICAKNTTNGNLVIMSNSYMTVTKLSLPTTIPSGGGYSPGVTRPSYNTGIGLFVKNGILYDSNGVPFTIQGVNIDDETSLANSAPSLVSAGVNAVRYNVYQAFNLAQMAQWGAAMMSNNIVFIPTFQNIPNTSSDKLSGDTNTSNLAACASQWASSYSSLSNTMFQKHMILNIANEWGPSGSSTWASAYNSAISTIRTAGYTCPIMIDSGGFGQDAGDLTTYANAVYQSDPQHNLIFGIHLYNTAAAALSGSPNTLAQLQTISAANGPVFAVMEFANNGTVFNTTNITATQMINACAATGLGWAAWTWDDPIYGLGGSDSYQMTVVQGVSSATPANAASSGQLTAYGKEVVPFFANTSKATDFP